MAGLIFAVPLGVFAQPSAEPDFRPFFHHYIDQRSITEKALNIIGLTSKDIGRSFALIAGVSRYDHIDDLPPAEVDINNLKRYLVEQEFFDEIVVLQDADFTEHNLRYFLQQYFPDRVGRFPRSRFLFAFSGHGMNDDNRGYLLFHDATHMQDRYRSINLSILRTYIQEVVRRGHHVLALINACYGGNFVRASYGDERLIPRKPGAHGITAGGPNQLVYADAEVGPGSVFFETLFAALDKRADTYPLRSGGRRGDGVITVDELHTDLRETIRAWSKDTVSPLRGDLNPPSIKSLGGFFFLDRDRQVAEGTVPPWKPRSPTAVFGTDPAQTAANTQALLRECVTHFKANRLTTGYEGNAVDCYKEVLELDPGNPEALEGLDQVVEQYADWSERAIARKQFKRAETYLERLAQVNPEYPGLVALRDQLISPIVPDTQLGKTTPSGKVFRDRLADDSQGPEMVVIPAGTFKMGSERRYSVEKPVHRVRVRRFAMSTHEITKGQFARFVKASDYKTQAEIGSAKGCYIYYRKDEALGWQVGTSWRNPNIDQDDDHPVVCVSWNDAQAYVKWLREKTGKKYRLPSEAEWEYAARAGSTTQYPWGDKIGRNKANCNVCGSQWDNEGTAPVGSFAANEFGLFDTVGNVWEWVEDCWHESYEGAPNDGRAWISGGKCNLRVLRGGSWGFTPHGVRSATRSWDYRDFRFNYSGFRLAQDL